LNVSHSAIIAELIATEKELGNDLNYVVEKYINPSVLDPNAPDCVKENRDLIFGNFKKIAEFHNS
jgi:RhoGEF domain